MLHGTRQFCDADERSLCSVFVHFNNKATGVNLDYVTINYKETELKS